MMRFLIEYKDFYTKEEKNSSLSLLDTFLNEYFIGDYHGQSFECLLIRFVNHPPIHKKYKLKTLYGSIAEVELVGHFTDNKKVNIYDFQQGLLKVEEAIRLVPQIEMRSELDFDLDKLLNTWKTIVQKSPQTDDELKDYAKREKEIKYQNTVKRVDCLIDSYKMHPKPLTKNIIGVRVYDHFDRNTLSPYSYIYSQLFSNLLRKAEVKSPGYQEIYFSIAETIEQAKQSFALETWHKYTYSTLNLSQYQQSDEEDKSKMVFQSMCEGLQLISNFDYLEQEKINGVIDFIINNGIDTELIYATAQNKDYLVEVVYRVPPSPFAKADFKLRLTDLDTNSTGIVPIDALDIDYAPFSIGKIQLSKKEVVIKGRNSLKAEISRSADQLPSEYRFSISEILPS
jgi:hypothetical protein